MGQPHFEKQPAALDDLDYFVSLFTGCCLGHQHRATKYLCWCGSLFCIRQVFGCNRVDG